MYFDPFMFVIGVFPGYFIWVMCYFFRLRSKGDETRDEEDLLDYDTSIKEQAVSNFDLLDRVALICYQLIAFGFGVFILFFVFGEEGFFRNSQLWQSVLFGVFYLNSIVLAQIFWIKRYRERMTLRVVHGLLIVILLFISTSLDGLRLLGGGSIRWILYATFTAIEEFLRVIWYSPAAYFALILLVWLILLRRKRKTPAPRDIDAGVST